MCLGKKSVDSDTLSLNEFNLKSNDYKIILGITIDRKLTFNQHIKEDSYKPKYTTNIFTLSEKKRLTSLEK